MRALVGGLGFLPVLPGSAVFAWARWFCGRSWWRPGQAAMTWGAWRRGSARVFRAQRVAHGLQLHEGIR